MLTVQLITSWTIETDWFSLFSLYLYLSFFPLSKLVNYFLRFLCVVGFFHSGYKRYPSNRFSFNIIINWIPQSIFYGSFLVCVCVNIFIANTRKSIKMKSPKRKRLLKKQKNETNARTFLSLSSLMIRMFVAMYFYIHQPPPPCIIILGLWVISETNKKKRNLIWKLKHSLNVIYTINLSIKTKESHPNIGPIRWASLYVVRDNR